MNKLTILVCIVAISVIHADRACAQWKQLDVGQAGCVQAVAVINGDVFAGTMAGIYRSTDNGASWTNVNSAFAYCFASKGLEIFAGTYRNGVLRSTDGGQRWIQSDTGFNRWIMALAIKDSVIFAGGAGMFRSTDDGASWTTIENGMQGGEASVTGLAVDSMGLYASTFQGVMFSSDEGNNWSYLVGTGDANQFTNCVGVYDSTILVGSPTGMLRSTDDGYTWTRPDVPSGIVLSVAMDSSYFYAGGVSGVSLSTDRGATWADISNGLPGSQVLSIAVKHLNLFAATFNNGVFRSTDNGTKWAPATAGIITSEVNSLAGYGSNVYAVMNYNSVFTSTDYGSTWTEDTSLHSGPVNSVSVIGTDLYAVTNTGIYVSSDKGVSWDTLNGGVLGRNYPGILIQSGSNLIVACKDSGHVYLSSDNGDSWDNVGSDLPEIASMTTCGTNVLAGTHDGMYLSTNNGETWNNVNDTLININALATVGSDIFAGRYFWPYPIGFAPPSPPGGVFRSTDGGLSWSPFNSGIPEYPQVYSIAVHGENIFAGSSPGLYASTITGNNWVNVGRSLPEFPVLSMYVNDSNIYVGMQRGGIWSVPLSEVTAIKQPTWTTVPSSFRLLQNYPNPFNPTTTISYQLSAVTQVNLSVYDILGRRVETMVNAKQNAGSYNVTFDANRLASGVYFYRLEAGAFSQTKKLMVIK